MVLRSHQATGIAGFGALACVLLAGAGGRPAHYHTTAPTQGRHPRPPLRAPNEEAGGGSQISPVLLACQDQGPSGLRAVRRIPASHVLTSASGQTIRGLPSGQLPADLAISPSGRYVAATVWRPDTPPQLLINDVWLIDLRRSTARRLTNDAQGYTAIRWSPDETSVAYLSSEGFPGSVDQTAGMRGVAWAVYVQTIASSRRRRVFQGSSGAGDTDRHPLEWVTKSGGLLFGSVSPRGLYLLRRGRPPVRVSGLVPDGVSLAGRVAWWIDNTRGQIRFAAIPADGSTLRSLRGWRQVRPGAPLSVPGTWPTVSLSPDGALAAIEAYYRKGTSWAFVPAVVDWRARTIRVLGRYQWPGSLQWSPHSRRLYLLRWDKGQSWTREVYEVRLESTASVPLRRANWRNPRAASLRPLFRCTGKATVSALLG